MPQSDLMQARGRGPRLIAAGLLAALAAAGAALAFASAGSAAPGPAGGLPDPAAQEGPAPNKTPEERRAELGREPAEGEFYASVAGVIDFEGPGAPGRAYVENLPCNLYDMRAEISLAETGEVVYASGLIAPGAYVEDVLLEADLGPGAHDAVATFTAYDRETRAERCRVQVEVVLNVR